MKSQNQIILEALENAAGNPAGGWVPMPDLMRAADSGNVHSRINDLRHAGHKIENRIETAEGPRKKSFYRLAVAEPQLVSAP